MSLVASRLHPAMLNVKDLNYDAWQAVYFQRGSVIVTELVLVLALSYFIQTAPAAQKTLSHAAALSILLSPGLLIIDHIHFQYNGFLYGVLILSLVLARRESTLLLSGILFAALLCLKHIYLYLAPAYFVFLLRVYCLGKKSIFHIKFFNAIKLGISIIAVFAIAFGPFVYMGQMQQLLSRLFPFSRGLCHAYWAPNVWAMYSFTDRVLIYGEKSSVISHVQLLIVYSGSTTWLSGRLRSRQQSYSRSSRRYVLRSPARCSSKGHLRLDLGISDRTAPRALSQFSMTT